MKNILSFGFTAAVIFAFSFQGFSQTREIGARFTGLDNIGLVYKKERKENKYIRHNFAVAQFNYTSRNLFQANMSYAFGFEKRKPIGNNMIFYRGIQPSFGVNYLRANFNLNQPPFDEIFGAYVGLGYMFGFMYSINERFYVSLETIPSIDYFYIADEYGFRSSGIRGGFNTNLLAATVAYRFGSSGN
jgi:hypothetical protein